MTRLKNPNMIIFALIFFLPQTVMALPMGAITYNSDIRYTVDTNMPGVNFEGKNLAPIEITALIDLKDKEGLVRDITFSFPSNQLSSGIDVRDRHTQDKIFAPLNKGQLPATIQFSLKEAKCLRQETNKQWDCHGQGPIKIGEKALLHDFPFTLADDGKVKSEFSLSLNELGITAPSYMGVVVDDKVKINIDASIKK